VGFRGACASRLGVTHGLPVLQGLLDGDRLLALLDRYGGHGDLAATVSRCHHAWRAAVAAAAELLSDPQELARRIELLSHQADEIAAAALQPDEDQALEQQLRAADHAETIARGADEAGSLDLATVIPSVDRRRVAVCRSSDRDRRHRIAASSTP
jgi:DNA repair ATPase RecN